MVSIIEISTNQVLLLLPEKMLYAILFHRTPITYKAKVTYILQDGNSFMLVAESHSPTFQYGYLICDRNRLLIVSPKFRSTLI